MARSGDAAIDVALWHALIKAQRAPEAENDAYQPSISSLFFL
jgi:hypothetical protein